MEAGELLSLVEHLEDNIDDLEESLEPLLAVALSATTKKLPVLDKAKLYVLIVYSIESLLFSYLRLHGVQAKAHAVFTELTRVKQYFEKVKAAEEGPTKPRQNLSLNKQAAGRVIKHALAGKNKADLERAEREAREKFLAKRKPTKSSEKRTPQEQLKQQSQEQPQDVGGPRKDAKAQEDSDSESSSEEDDREDAEMADAIDAMASTVADSREAMVDAPVESTDQSGCSTRKRKYGNKTGQGSHQPFTAVTQIAQWQAERKGNGRRKRKRGGPGRALLKEAKATKGIILQAPGLSG